MLGAGYHPLQSRKELMELNMKVLNRLAALVLCASMAVTGLGVQAAEVTVYSDDFSSYTDIPDGNWTVTTPNSSEITVDNQMLKITTPSSYSGKAIAQYTLPEALDGVVTVEYKAMINAASNNFCAPYIYSDTGKVAVCTMFNNNGNIQSYANGSYQVVGQYSVGEWYSVKHILDYDNSKFSLYINDEKCIDSASFRYGDSSNLSYMQFYAERANSEIYFDDLKISKQAEEPAPEEFALSEARLIAGTQAMTLYDGMLGVPCDIEAIELEFSAEPEVSALNNISVSGVDYQGSYADKIWRMELKDELENDTEYTITLDGIKSADGKEISQTISFTTIAADVLYFEGFDVLPDGNTSGSVAIAYDSDRRSNVLKVTGQTSKSETMLEFTPSDYGVAADDIVVIDFDVNAVRSANASIPYVYNASGSPVISSIFSSGGSVNVRNGNATETMCSYKEGKWHNVKVCLDYKNSAFNFIFDGVLVGDSYGFRNTLTAGEKCRISFYIDAGKSGTVKVDNLQIYKASAPVIDTDNTEFINGGSLTMDKNSVYAGNTDIYIPCDSTVAYGEFRLYKNDEIIDVTATPDRNGFSLDIAEPLAYNCDFTLTATIKSIYGKQASYEYSFKTANDTVYISSAEFGADGVNAVIVNNTGAPCNVNIFLAGYDENNCMTGCRYLPKTLEAGENPVSVTLAGKGEYKLYVWSGDMLSPAEYGVYTASGVEGKSEKTPNSADNTFAAEDNFSKTYPDTGVEIKASAANGGQITLIMLKPDADISDFAEEDIVYIGQQLCDSNNSTGFDFAVASDLPTGEYKLYIGGESAAGHKTATLSYTGADAVTDIITAIDSETDSSEMFSMILSNSALLGIDTAELENIGEEGTAAVEAALFGNRPFVSPEKFISAYNDIYYSYLFNNTDDVSEYVAAYAGALGIDLSKDSKLGKLFSQESGLREETEKAVSAKNDFTGVSEIRSCYYNTATLGAVNSAGRGNIIDRCELFAAELGIDIEGSYATLSESQKQKLAIELIDGQEYSSAAVFAAEFDSAVKEVRKQTSSGTSSGGGGGGGSAFVGVSSVTAPVTQTDSDKSAKLFDDVDDSDWFAYYVNRLGGLMIVSGDENGNFNPYDHITRAEFIKLLVAVFDCYNSSLASDFDDVEQGKWYSPYIASARAAGFVNGYDNKVMPEAVITRQDAAVMAVGAAEASGIAFDSAELAFSDSASIADYAAESVKKATGNGIMSGMGDGSFEPAGNMTRAQAAVVICGLMEVLQ